MYDAYVYTYGRVNKSSRAFANDPESSIPAALENEVTQKYQARLSSGKHVQRLRQVYVPADILSKRSLYPTAPPERADSVADAATISRSWKGAFDLPYMGKLLGKSPEDVKQEIIAKGLGFEDPATGRVVPKDEYLSGNVKEKLRVAEESAGENPQYQGNIEALRAVQPEPLKIHQIRFSLGATWMPTQVLDGWLDHLFRPPRRRPRPPRCRRPGGSSCNGIRGSGRMPGIPTPMPAAASGQQKLIEDALNLKASIAYDEEYDPDTRKTKRVKNPERTAAAQDAQQKAEGRLLPVGAAVGLRAGNRSRVQPSPQRLPSTPLGGRRLQALSPRFRHGGTAPLTRRHPWRGNMVESNLMAHPVGSGKTYIYATTAMEWEAAGAGQ